METAIAITADSISRLGWLESNSATAFSWAREMTEASPAVTAAAQAVGRGNSRDPLDALVLRALLAC